jgi:hypothetical protein|uniref:Uncharacterized protein n=1 Tax=Zea mays TaxID=4577 RepID=C4J7T5_MAIZE|nr:unknown [Zea mays]
MIIKYTLNSRRKHMNLDTQMNCLLLTTKYPDGEGTGRGCHPESQAVNYRDKRRSGCVFYFQLAILDRSALNGFAQVG